MIRFDWVELVLPGMMMLAVLASATVGSVAQAEGDYRTVPGSLVDAIGECVTEKGQIKVDADTVCVPCRLVAVGVKPVEGAGAPVEGMGRIAYRLYDPKTGNPKEGAEVQFQIEFTCKDDKWTYAKAVQVTTADGKESLTPVEHFNPPPPKPKLGALEGEAGKTVQTTASGLKYVVLEEGKGDKPKKGATIAAEYTGWLEADGTQFDSSKDHDGAFEFPVGEGNVIPGWDEALLDMKVGERRKLIVPANLGYGERGAGNVIPPNATLVFEVKLVAIK